MQCLDEQKLIGYLRGELPVGELIAVSEHVGSCEACRAKLRATRDFRKSAWSVGEVVLAVGECPEYEDLSSFVDGGLSHEAYRHIERHINLCELCWSDVETLQEARSRASLAPELVVEPGHFGSKRRWFVLGWQKASALAVGAAAVIAVAVVMHPGPQIRTTPTQIAQTPPTMAAPTPDKPDSPAANVPEKPVAAAPDTTAPIAPAGTKPTPPPVNQAPKPVFVAELKDGSVTVGRTNGKLQVRSQGRELEAQIAALVEKKLKNAKLPASFTIAMNSDALRTPSAVMDITKISPTPDSLAENRPEFQWEPVDGAMAYRVEVYDLKGNPVVSAVTEETSYQPDEKLTGGGYLWMVWTRRGALAEWEPSRAASFRVLSASERKLISGAEETGSHLVLGSVYESLGLNESAVREFEALAAENPNSALAGKMLDGARK